MRLPVVYASPPSPALYVMGALEMPAYPSPTDEEEKEEDDDDDFRAAANPVLAPPAVARGSRGSGVLPSASRPALGDDEKYLHDGRSAVPAARAAAVAARLCNVSDYTLLASHVWVDGVRDGRTGRYLPHRTPFLTKRVHRSCVLLTPPPRLSLPLIPASSLPRPGKPRKRVRWWTAPGRWWWGCGRWARWKHWLRTAL